MTLFLLRSEMSFSPHVLNIEHSGQKWHKSKIIMFHVVSTLHRKRSDAKLFKLIPDWIYRLIYLASHSDAVCVTFHAKVRYSLNKSCSECERAMWRCVCTSGHLHYSSPLVTNVEFIHHNVDVRFQSVRLLYTQGVPEGNVNILGGHSIGHSKQKSVYVHVSYSERFPK
jgi:hypothetical protein